MDQILRLNDSMRLSNHIPRRVRPVYIGPTQCIQRSRADVPGRDAIGVASVAAPYAYELALALAVLLGYVTAPEARSGRVPRVHEHGEYASQASLVGHERTKLSEAPRMQGPTLCLPNRYPVTDAVEVFDGDAAPGALGTGHQSFADAVVRVTSEAALLAPPLAKQSLRGLGSLGLELSSQACVAMPERGELSTAVPVAVAVGRDVHDAEVDAENVVATTLDTEIGVGRQVYADMQVELAVLLDEVSLVLDAERRLDVALNSDLDATVERCDGCDATLERQDARVERNSRTGAKRRADGAVALEAGSNVRDDADGHLCEEPVLDADVLVDELLNVELAEAFRLERETRRVGRSGIHRSYRPKQRVTLLDRSHELELADDEHVGETYRDSSV